MRTKSLVVGLRIAIPAAVALLLNACGGGTPTNSVEPSDGMGAKLSSALSPRFEMVADAIVQSAPNKTATALRPLASANPSSPVAELIWYSPSAGSTVSWSINGSSRLGRQALLDAPGWRVTHTADFNGDGQLDLLWQNVSTGQVTLWLMDSGQLKENRPLLAAPGWRVTYVGDFNGDGKSDLVFENKDSGQTVMWLMDGATKLESAELLRNPDFSIVAVADLDGDGRTDLVWQAPKLGKTSAWLMNGVQRKQSADLLDAPDWQVSACTDLNGDGRADLIWWNPVTGQTAAWIMNGLQRTDSSLLLTAQNWRVTKAVDLDGDGFSDLIWENSNTGQTVAWTMQGLQRKSSTELLSAPGWTLAHVSDLDGDKSKDLIWYNPQSGQSVVWLMRGLQKLSQAEILPAGSDYRVEFANSVNRAPIASIAGLSSARVGSIVSLEGHSSTDPNGDTLSYSWQLTSKPVGSQASIGNASMADTTLVPDLPGNYTVALKVSDGKTTSTATATFTATAMPSHPSVEILRGRWYFTHTIISDFNDVYTLDRVIPDTTNPGEDTIFGTDQYGNIVVAGYSTKLAAWTLLDQGIIIDYFYEFQTNGLTILSGCAYQITRSTREFSRCFPLRGIKAPLSSAAGMAMGAAPEGEQVRESRAFDEDRRSRSGAGQLGQASEALRERYLRARSAAEASPRTTLH